MTYTVTRSVAIEMRGTRVLLEPVEKAYKGSLIVPDSAKDATDRAVVIAVSPEIDSNYKPELGDTVIFSKYSGNTIEIDDKNYIALDISDIIAVVR